MKNISFLLVIAVTSVLMFSCNTEQKPNTLTKAETQEGWQLLFDGETTKGWHSFNETTVNDGWIVEEGKFVCLGKGGDIGGDIVTDEKFDNFEIKFDWAISKGGNSGLFYHSLEDSTFEAPYQTGPEYQLIDDFGFPTPLEEWQMAGSDYAMYVFNEKKTLNPAGEWNQTRLVFDNGDVQHWLNGEMIVNFTAWSADWYTKLAESKWKDYPLYGISRDGLIGLQDHGDSISFQNIKIKRLPAKEINLFNGKDLSGWTIYGTEKWYVENGLLVCESGPEEKYGYLGTNTYFDDYELSLKFKQEANGNSGVFVRSTVNGTIVSGWQVEVAPPNNNTGAIYESYGRGWLNDIPEEKEDILKMGEWNDMKIKVVGDHIQTYLNGELMTDLKDEKIGNGKGRIALQIHDGGGIKIYWKDFVLKQL